MVIKTKQSSKADYDRHNYDDNDDNTTITMTTNDYTKWLTFLFFHVPAQLVNTAPFPYFLSVTCLHVLSPCRRLRSAPPHLWLTRQLLWSTCQHLSSTRQHLWSTRQYLWSTRQLSFSITRPLPWSSRQLLWSTNQRLSSIRLHPWSPRLHLWSPYLHLWTLSRLAYI